MKKYIVSFLGLASIGLLIFAGMPRAKKNAATAPEAAAAAPAAYVPGAKKNATKVRGIHDITTIKDFDEKKFSETRRVEVKKFVDKAVEYLKKNELSRALHAFSHDKEFRFGEIYIFVYDYNGVCLAHGEDPEMIWENRMGKFDIFGTPVVDVIIKTAKVGGGWINYQRKNASKVSYVTGVTKNGRKMAIGAGFYPLSKSDSVVALVKGAVESFNRQVEEGKPPQAAFSEFSYSLGRFVIGDLYLYALDFKGNIMAQGDRPGLIGTNAIDYKTAGKYLNRDIISELTLKEGGVWVDYVSKGAPKRAYAEKVIDKEGKKYFIACGYYPDTNRKEAVALVRRGYVFMEKNGLTVASREFSERGKEDFRYGDLWLFVFDFEGKCVAHGANIDLIGKNMYDDKDQDGKLFVKEFIKTAKGGGGWVDYKIRNGYRFVYVEEIEVAGKKYVIGCGLFPISKAESMQLLVKGAAGTLRDLPKEEAFAEFVKKDGRFVKGDLEIFVFDFTGICYAYGFDFYQIWKDMMKTADEDGRPFVKMIINTAKDGSGVVVYKKNGRMKTSYVMSVEKNGKSYAVGSGFFIK
ncbi:cache domain-containing protein [Candidatus Dependentiae bacterium]